MNRMDETAVLRFSSGEMNVQEESTFLAQCEIEPTLWREAVLAVVEHRRVVAVLGEFGAMDATPAPRAREEIQGRVRWRSAGVLALGAMVAGLFLGSMATRLASPPNGRSLPSVGTTLATAREGGSAPTAAIDENSASGATWLQRGSRAKSPTDAALRDLVGPRQSESLGPETVEAVLRNGPSQVEEQPVLYIIDTGSGTRWAIPTKRTTFHYVNR